MPWKKISCSKAKFYFTELNINARDFKGLVNNFTKHGDSDNLNNRLLEITQNNLTNLSELLYDGLPDVELSIKKAKEIMGEDFYGAERYLEVFGQELYLDELGRVPFTVSELRKAKERGMRLVARYDLKTVPEPSIAFQKIQDLSINLSTEYQKELTESVENGWALVGERGELTYLYQHAQDSWERALEFLGIDLDNEAFRDVKDLVESIKNAYLEGDIDTANEDLSDLMAGNLSNGPYFLVKANEAIYDALLISNGDPKLMREMLDSVITGSVVEKTAKRWEFLALDYFFGTGQNFEFSDIRTTTHGLNRVLEKGMPYQIRV